MPIDYARMQKAYPRQKAALTRALNSGNPQKIANVCAAAVVEWNEIGAWPDGWQRWNSAYRNATGNELDSLR